MNSEHRKLLRKRMISAREQLSTEERMYFSQLISKRILESDIYHSSHTIMIYKSVKGEVCLDKLERTALSQGKRLCYPLCISQSEMIALSPKDRVFSAESPCWRAGAFGIWEPVMENSTQIAPSEIDLIICPCTTFDESCGRMGMGAGYYDRYISKCINAHIAAVAFEVQKTESVPMETWDKKMDCIFTEKQVYINQKF